MSIPLRYGTTLIIIWEDLFMINIVSIPLRYGTTITGIVSYQTYKLVSIPLRYGTTAVFSYYY